jgi:two-component system, NarL family, sensor histidine kinase UhpB
LDLQGNLAALPQSVSTSVYRIAQECLTNAMRHGRPSDVHLRVERAPSRDADVAVTVEDDGGGSPASISSAGHGILGMRERIAALGGSLTIGRAAGGLRVAARIPLAQPVGATPLTTA